jgi:hypothetical protein
MTKYASFTPFLDAVDPDGNVYAALPANIGSLTGAQLLAAGLVAVAEDFWADVSGRMSALYSVDQGLAKLVLTPVVLPNVQAQMTQSVTRGCAAQIALGFSSSALGAAYTYPLDLTSQSNLQAAVTRMQLPNPPASINYMCADSTGAWARRAHTPAQITQAALDGMTYVESVLAKKDALVVQINAATTAAAAQAITWSFP